MPEGPSIVIAKEEMTVFIGKKVVEAIGNAKIDMDRIEGKVKEIAEQARIYSLDFLKWKKANQLKKHWLVHTKKECAQCDEPLVKEYTGKKKVGVSFVPLVKNYMYEYNKIFYWMFKLCNSLLGINLLSKRSSKKRLVCLLLQKL